jgi:hypothetical protein
MYCPSVASGAAGPYVLLLLALKLRTACISTAAVILVRLRPSPTKRSECLA